MNESDVSVMILLAGAAALGVSIYKRWLSRRAFVDAPTRRTPLESVDIAAGFFVLICGMLLFSMVINRVAPASSADGQKPGDVVLRSLLYQLIVLAPVAVYAVMRCMRDGAWRELGVVPRSIRRELPMAAVGLMIAAPLVFGVITAVTLIGEPLGLQEPDDLSHTMLRALRDADSIVPVIGIFLSAAVLAPVLEEVIYRGLIQTALVNTLGADHRWLVVLTAGILFGVIHVGQPPQQLVGLVVLGICLGWLYERSGSLWPSILVHAGFNAINLTMVLMGAGGSNS